MFEELDEKHSQETSEYCSRVKHLDSKQAAQRNAQKLITLFVRATLISVGQLNSIIQQQHSKYLTPITRFETFEISQRSPSPKWHELEETPDKNLHDTTEHTKLIKTSTFQQYRCLYR